MAGIVEQLTGQHRLLAEALDLFTHRLKSPRIADRVSGVFQQLQKVDWQQLQAGQPGSQSLDFQVSLYEDFLEAYDPELRKKSGSYYTPRPVVDAMVRLADEALRLTGVDAEGRRWDPAAGQGLGDEGVRIIDPAMGTGTFLLSILQWAADQLLPDGRGTAYGRNALNKIVGHLYGLEKQIAPLRGCYFHNAHYRR